MRKTPLASIIALCAIVGGLQVAEDTSNNLLPLTLHRFTASAPLIGLILAVHPAFGFIAQPIVGILGDRIWTPVGRRAFFLVTCAPLAALCLWTMPLFAVFWQLVASIVAFQLFLALLWGSDHPLITDLVPAPQRTLVKGWMMASMQLASFLFVKGGIGFAIGRFGEAAAYRIAAAVQVALVAGAALFLRETRAPPAVRPKLTIRRYVGDLLGDRILRRFALLGFVYSIFVNIVLGFFVLFAVQALQHGREDFARAWSMQALIALGCAVPLGFAIERLPKQWVLVAGFLLALGGCACGIFAASAGSLYAIAIPFGLGWLLVELTLKPFFSDYLPPDIVGQLTGAYNICYAAGRVVALVGAGWAVGLSGNHYRAIWVLALPFGAAAGLVAASIPDRRRGARRPVAATS